MTDSYAYNAALYCADCALILRKQLDDKGIEDDETTDTYPQPVFSSESDCAESCDQCGTFLENDLTDEGIASVASWCTSGNLSDTGRVIAEYYSEFYSEISEALNPTPPDDEDATNA